MRGSIVRNFFGGIDPVSTTNQFSSWTDPSLKSLYAIRYNDKVLSLLDDIARETAISESVAPRSAVVSTGFVQASASVEGIDEETTLPGAFDETA